MLAYLSQVYKCLYCIWPALVIGVALFLSKTVDGKTYYGSLTPGVDPASPQGQAEFETSRQRNAEKRRIIYWAAGIIAFGYLAAFLANTFTIRVRANSASTPTPTMTIIITLLPTATFHTETPMPTPTLTPLPSASISPTYPPTATARTIYVAGPKETVIVTVIKVVTRVVTITPTKTPTPTPTLTDTIVPTFTLAGP